MEAYRIIECGNWNLNKKKNKVDYKILFKKLKIERVFE